MVTETLEERVELIHSEVVGGPAHNLTMKYLPSAAGAAASQQRFASEITISTTSFP
jgi:hypothetical protein